MTQYNPELQNNMTNNKRKDIVDKCKISIKTKFQNTVKILKARETYDNDYTSKMFESDMGKLINFTQQQLNKLKLSNGTFHNTDKLFKPQRQTMETIKEEPIEYVKKIN